MLTLLVSCGKRQKKVLVNEEVVETSMKKSGAVFVEDDNVYTQRLSTTQAIGKITFIDVKYKDFWNTVNDNYIDTEYCNTKVRKGNIRLLCKANQDYALKWLDELDKTYNELADILDEEVEDKLLSQYNAFKDYYNQTEKIGEDIINNGQEYSGHLDGFYRVRHYYYLADMARSYTILLKEYIYMQTKSVRFYYTNDEDEEVKANKKFSSNSININFTLVNDEKFRDIVKDKYDGKINCSIKKLEKKEAEKKTNKYSDYWYEQVNKNMDKLSEELSKEHIKLFEKQLEAHNLFVKTSTDIQHVLLLKTETHKLKYKDATRVDNNYFRMKWNVNYNTLLLEYCYSIVGKLAV